MSRLTGLLADLVTHPAVGLVALIIAGFFLWAGLALSTLPRKDHQ